jgi:hypothetical protein
MVVEIREPLQQFELLGEGAAEVGIIVGGAALASHAVGSPGDLTKALVDAAALGDVLIGRSHNGHTAGVSLPRIVEARDVRFR